MSLTFPATVKPRRGTPTAQLRARGKETCVPASAMSPENAAIWERREAALMRKLRAEIDGDADLQPGESSTGGEPWEPVKRGMAGGHGGRRVRGHGEIAARILAWLAQHRGERHTTGAIGDAVNEPRGNGGVSRALQLLARQGWVRLERRGLWLVLRERDTRFVP